MSSLPTISTDIARISANGYPIATETYNGNLVLVFGAKPGETVTVQLVPDNGFIQGKIIDPTPAQERRGKEQRRGAKNRRKGRNRDKKIIRQKPKKPRSKSKQSLQDIGKKLGGISIEKQDRDATLTRFGGYGNRNDGRDKRRGVAHKYD